jgi:hypothetical protein
MRNDTKVLLSTTQWRMEEAGPRKVVVLKRTSTPFRDLDLLVQENDAVIGQIRSYHKGFGIVVDMREAPLRNDPAFENSMEILRTVISRRFARVAVLIATGVGVLQINRITREDGHQTFATRSETEAIKFAQGEG